MKKPKISYKKIYSCNPATGAYLIEVSLDKYEDLFNEWDPAPFKRRDMDPDLHNFLETCESDIPDHEAIEIHFVLPAAVENTLKEENARTGLSNYFAYEMASLHGDLRREIKRSGMYLLIAIGLLFLATLLGRVTQAPFGFSVLKEGITIGAWVFTWEAISTFFFRRFKMIRHKKQWARLSRCPVYFQKK